MLVLDAGAFVALERGSRDVVALIKRERLAGRSPTTSGGVVAQVWRGGSGRQVPMARLLAGTTWLPSTTGWDDEPACSLAAAASPMLLTPLWCAWQPTATTSSLQIPATCTHLRKQPRFT